MRDARVVSGTRRGYGRPASRGTAAFTVQASGVRAPHRRGAAAISALSTSIAYDVVAGRGFEPHGFAGQQWQWQGQQ
jgi:hypothetical protein